MQEPQKQSYHDPRETTAASPSPSRPASAFDHAAERLQGSLEELSRLVSGLEDRLAQVLSSTSEPHPDEAPLAPPGTSSAVGFVWNAANGADATADRIRRLLDRVELS